MLGSLLVAEGVPDIHRYCAASPGSSNWPAVVSADVTSTVLVGFARCVGVEVDATEADNLTAAIEAQRKALDGLWAVDVCELDLSALTWPGLGA
jgi:hypothetical protein